MTKVKKAGLFFQRSKNGEFIFSWNLSYIFWHGIYQTTTNEYNDTFLKSFNFFFICQKLHSESQIIFVAKDILIILFMIGIGIGTTDTHKLYLLMWLRSVSVRVEYENCSHYFSQTRVTQCWFLSRRMTNEDMRYIRKQWRGEHYKLRCCFLPLYKLQNQRIDAIVDASLTLARVQGLFSLSLSLSHIHKMLLKLELEPRVEWQISYRIDRNRSQKNSCGIQTLVVPGQGLHTYIIDSYSNWCLLGVVFGRLIITTAKV
jgi:hypothetical protein